MEVAEELCSEKSKLFKNLTVGANTAGRRIGDIGENIVSQIASHASKFCHLSLTMNESLDMCDTSQLLVFVTGVDKDLNVTQELASLNSKHGTVTGEDFFNELNRNI